MFSLLFAEPRTLASAGISGPQPSLATQTTVSYSHKRQVDNENGFPDRARVRKQWFIDVNKVIGYLSLFLNWRWGVRVIYEWKYSFVFFIRKSHAWTSSLTFRCGFGCPMHCTWCITRYRWVLPTCDTENVGRIFIQNTDHSHCALSWHLSLGQLQKSFGLSNCQI